MISWLLSFFSIEQLTEALAKKKDVIHIAVMTSEDMQEMAEQIGHQPLKLPEYRTH